MNRVVIVGSAGRMGKRLVYNILESEDMELAGAVECEGNPVLGQDAGMVAGHSDSGVKIESELNLENADAVIDFSTGGTVLKNARNAVKNNCSVIIGTTALSDDEQETLKKLAENGGRIILASNFSLGVNLLFHLSEQLAEKLDSSYNIEIVEMHHNQKKDSPSGTAVTLGEKVCKGRGLDYKKDVKNGREGVVGARSENEIGMHALRGGDVVGDHTVIFATEGERIELAHKASSRDAFVKGALEAVRYLENADSGFYSMKNVLDI